jgi:hypothetical protein
MRAVTAFDTSNCCAHSTQGSAFDVLAALQRRYDAASALASRIDVAPVRACLDNHSHRESLVRLADIGIVDRAAWKIDKLG